MAEALARAGLCVHRFEFSYMGSAPPRDRAGAAQGSGLIPEFMALRAETVRAGLLPGQTLIAGEVDGGRVASMAIDAPFAIVAWLRGLRL